MSDVSSGSDGDTPAEDRKAESIAASDSATALDEPTEDVDPGATPDSDVELGASGSTDEAAAPRAPRFDLSEQASNNLVAIVVGLALVVGLLANTAPTGGAIVDVIYSLGFIIAVVWAATTARRGSLLWFAAIAFVFTGFQPWLLASGAAFGLMLLTRIPSSTSFGTRLGPAVVAGLGLQGVLRFPGLGFTGSASLLAATAVLPLLIAGWRSLTGERRRVGRRAIGAAALVGIIGVAGAGASVLWARSSAEAGIDAAEEGLDFARAADQDEAIERLAVAENNFVDADNTLGAFWAKPARLVPIVAQHARAVETAAEQGAALTRAAAAAASTADIDQVRVSGGRIDLDLLASVGTELESTLITVNRAVEKVDEVSVPWLLPTLANRITDVRVELADAQAEIDLAAHATRVVPDMLGADGPRKYLVIFTTPAESRELGGFIGNWALLGADDGKISLTRSGRIKELNPCGQCAPVEGVADPTSYPDRYISYQINRFFQNLTGTPDFPTVARATAEIFPQMGGEPIDGVMSVDPFAIAALLELSGPVTLDGLDEPLSSETVAEFLLEGQYEAFDTLLDREAALGTVAEKAFSTLLASEIPGPERLGAVLGPVARQDRLLMTTFDRDANDFLDRVFLRGAFPVAVPGADFLSVVHDAAIPRKLDTYLTRTIDYSVLFDPETGETTSRVTVRVRNDLPDGLDEYVAGELGDFTLGDGSDLPVGHNYLRLSIYTSGMLSSFRVDGAPAELGSGSEYGRQRYLSFLNVPPGEEVVAEFDLNQTLDPGPEYRLQIASQPLVNPDVFSVHTAQMSTPDAALSETFELTEDTDYTVSFGAP